MVTCAPGDKLGDVKTAVGGSGTHTQKNVIRATLLGRVETIPPAEAGGLKEIRVVGLRSDTAPIVPAIGQRVTAKISRINTRFASAQIVCVGSRAVKEAFGGMIRAQDVRVEEVDKVEIYKCFHPGDVVVAEVLSLGDSHSYYLMTAKSDLGVIYATSVAGGTMVAVSPTEMQCPITQLLETRKVAYTAAEEKSADAVPVEEE